MQRHNEINNENFQDVLEDKSFELNEDSNKEDELEDEDKKEVCENAENEKETHVKVDKNAFCLAFEKILESSKLKLTSGTVVEDTL